MQNVRLYKNIKLVTNEKEHQKLVASPLYEGSEVIGPELIAVAMGRSEIKLNMPIYTGFCVLDESKLVMYKFYYEKLLPFYGPERCKLCMTDTGA